MRRMENSSAGGRKRNIHALIRSLILDLGSRVMMRRVKIGVVGMAHVLF
jgi:hypothetical protein